MIINQNPLKNDPFTIAINPNPIIPNDIAIPIFEAIPVARSKSFFHFVNPALNIRPPSKGNAGIKLKLPIIRLTMLLYNKIPSTELREFPIFCWLSLRKETRMNKIQNNPDKA
jgi:hypothetical protein